MAAQKFLSATQAGHLARQFCRKHHTGARFGPSARADLRGLCPECAGLIHHRAQKIAGKSSPTPPQFTAKWEQILKSGRTWREPWLRLKLWMGAR